MTKAAEVQGATETLSAYYDGLLALLASGAEAGKDGEDHVLAALLSQARRCKQEGEAHLDATKNLRKKLSLFLQAL